jgi:hypothetical protein
MEDDSDIMERTKPEGALNKIQRKKRVDEKTYQ